MAWTYSFLPPFFTERVNVFNFRNDSRIEVSMTFVLLLKEVPEKISLRIVNIWQKKTGHFEGFRVVVAKTVLTRSTKTTCYCSRAIDD